MTPLRQARRAVRRGLALGLFVTAFLDVAVLAVPLYDMQLYDRVLLSHNMSTVAMLSVACGLGLLLYGILDYLRSAVLVAIAENVQGALYQPLLAAGVRASLSDQPAAGGEAMRDLHEMRIFLSSGALAVPLDALCAPLLLGVMFLLHPAYGWLGVIGVALLCILGILSDMLVRPAVVAAAKERTDAGNQLAAGLREADMTDGLGMMDAMARRWARRHGAALEEVRAAAGRSDTAGAVAKLARLGLQAGVMALGVVLILSNQASPGSLMGANLLLGKVLGPFDALISTWRRWIAVTAAWRRLSVLMAGRADVAAQVPPVPAPAFDHAGLVLSGVGFEEKATGRALLRDVALRLAPGTAMALVGPNGAGKSTLLRLMVGLLPASCGTVRLDGEAIATIDKTRIGYLPQGVHLLDGSIRHNVARFADSPMEAIVAAAAAADVHDLVGRMRHGYDTVVGQTTLSLSGGQKQRVGLARAMFGVPRLLGLDEPDASLDSEGEVALLRAIQAARDAGAVIVIATHRPKLLAAMDLVATLHDGRIQSVAPAFPAAPRQLAHA